MNKVYRVIFNVKKGCYTVVSEIAKRTGKSGGVLKSYTVAVSTLAVLISLGGIASVDAANYVNISGTEGSISASASKGMFGGSKEFNFNSEGISVTGTDYASSTKKNTIIQDGKIRTSDAKYASEHYTEIDGGSVRTENLKVVPTIKDSLEFKQGGLVVRSEDSRLIVSKNGIDQSVDNGRGQSNSVKVKQNGTVFRTTDNGAIGATETVIAGETIIAGDISINGEQDQSTITGLTNITVDTPDFATQGRAATEEQLKKSADKTKEELTNTIEASIAKSGNNITVDTDNHVNLNDAVYLGGTNTATDSNIQLDGAEGAVKATAKKGMFSGSKTMEFTGNGLSVTGTDYAGSTKKNTVIEDGKVRTSDAKYGSEHYTEIDGGSVRTENLKVVPTIKDSLEFKQGGLVVRSEDSRLIVSKNGIDQSVDNGRGQSNSVKVKQNGTVFRTTDNGATGATETVIAGETIAAGDISINGEQDQSTITGLTNTTVDAQDFATQGRAATEEQLKKSADKTKEELTNTIEASKAKSGNNITVDADNHVNLNDAVYLGGTNTAADSNIQLDGAKGTVKATAKKGMFSDSKTMEFTGNGLSVTGTDYAGSTKKNTVIEDGKIRTSDAKYGSEHYTEIDGGSVRTENLKVVPTIKDSLEFKQGGLVVRSEDSRLIVSKNGIDQSVDNGRGQSNSVKVKQTGTVFRTTDNGATGATETVIAGESITAGDISINGEQGQSTITGLTNTTVDTQDFATQGRAATEEQLGAVRKEMKNSGTVVNQQITHIDNRVNTVESKINAVQSQVSTLTERADKTDARIQTVEQSVSEHSKQIDDVTSRVDTVEKTIKDTAGDVRAVKNSVVAVDNKVDTVASDVKTVKESVQSVDSKVTKVDARVTSVETKVGTIDTSVINLSKEVQANTETLTTHTTTTNNRFATIESNINTLDQRVGSVESGIASVNQRVSKLDTRINKVGAGAAALAALHPVSGDGTKFGVAAGVGIYNGQKAVAIGGSYSPNDMTTISVGGAVGNGENMVNAGVSLKVGAGNAMSKAQMNSQIKSLQAENSALKAKDAVQDTQLQELRAEIAALKASMTK